MTLRRMVETTRAESEEILGKTRRIYRAILLDFASRGGANFSSLRTGDLKQLFGLYDQEFFHDCFQEGLGERPLRFRVSTRMTKAAGKTIHRRLHRAGGHACDAYEIAISSTLLLQTFRDVDRSITVSGIECFDRLEALQRVFEHELTHLLELVIWDSSRCSASRFQSMAARLFGHTEHTHQLITPRERAWRRFGIRPGHRVTFRLNGERFEGIVNRITKRATVLVEDERGARYSDGKRYARFYVPLSMLRMVRSKTLSPAGRHVRA